MKKKAHPLGKASDIDATVGGPVDRSSPLPYYVHVRDALRERIERAVWKPGDQLPAEPDLCTAFDVSRTVVRQALQELTYAGLVVREKGKGTFVAQPKIAEDLFQKLTGFYEDMIARGRVPFSQVLGQEVVPAGKKIAERLRIELDTPVIKIERLRFVQSEPIVLVTTYLPHALCPGLLQEDLSRQSLYACLETKFGLVITHGHRSLEAVQANEREARLLKIALSAPLLMLDSVGYLSDGTPLEYYHALHRGDRSRFEVELIRVQKPSDVDVLPAGDSLRLPIARVAAEGESISQHSDAGAQR
jgi:GntR family transcriptional regulator